MERIESLGPTGRKARNGSHVSHVFPFAGLCSSHEWTILWPICAAIRAPAICPYMAIALYGPVQHVQCIYADLLQVPGHPCRVSHCCTRANRHIAPLVTRQSRVPTEAVPLPDLSVFVCFVYVTCHRNSLAAREDSLRRGFDCGWSRVTRWPLSADHFEHMYSTAHFLLSCSTQTDSDKQTGN